MNMNKKFLFIIILLLFAFIGINKIEAATTTTKVAINCNSFTTKKQCDAFAKCNWVSGTCQFQNVAQEPCNDNNIRKVLKIFGYMLLVAKLVIPLLIIGLGTFDLYKSVVDKDEKSMYKQLKILGVRIITGLIVFFIPNFVYAIFSLSDTLNIIDNDDYKTCAECLLDPLDNSVCLVKE